MTKQVKEIDKTVGINLQNIRVAQGLSRAALGDAIGVSHNSIFKYERAINRISLSTAVLLSKVLECKLLDLVIGIDTLPDFVNLDKKSITLYNKITSLDEGFKRELIKLIDSRIDYNGKKEQIQQ
ncbi:MAG: helix-turn-helix transcriptional regulator [Aquiluna sp.]